MPGTALKFAIIQLSVTPRFISMEEQVVIRPLEEGDKNFVRSTWLKSFYKSGAKICENVDPQIYYSSYSKIVEKLLKSSSILVAGSAGSPDVIIGYCVFKRPNIVHYIYVKYVFKGFGIAKKLFFETGINSDDCSYTHRTPCMSYINKFTRKEVGPDGERGIVTIAGKYPKLVYNPFLILED